MSIEYSSKLQQIRDLVHLHKRKWIKIPEVASIAIGFVDTDEMGIIILVRGNPDKITKSVPFNIDGIKVKVRQTNELRALV